MRRISFTCILLILSIIALGFYQSERNSDSGVNKHYFVRVKNKSDRHILMFDWHKNYPANSGDSIPEQALCEKELDFSCKLLPNESKTLTFGMIHLRPVEDILLNDSVKVLFFDLDSIGKYGWGKAWVSQKGLLESRIITIEYLRENNWDICYPENRKTKKQ